MKTVETEKKAIIAKYSKKSDAIAVGQLATTFVPFAAFWYLAVQFSAYSYLLTGLCVMGLAVLLLRMFVLMHECGHQSLFKTNSLNRAGGFLLGVMTGMPQYVWSKNHAFHHATNGNWEAYRGPLATKSLAEYQGLTPFQQKMYQITRNIGMAPMGGFLYLIFNPRFTWFKGVIGLVTYIVREKLKNPGASVRSIAKSFETRYWKSDREFLHMTGNNIVLLSLWIAMSVWIGPALFFVIYLISLSLAGAGGIILFTVQHNFEGSWAVGKKDWDYNRAAVDSTSFLEFPAWLNWCTANIAYHHIHHLSAAIPNYRLAECHRDNQELFTNVTRIKLSEVPRALKNNIWDQENQRITSIAAISSN